MMERKDVPEKFKWKVTDVFENDEAWEREYKAIEEEYANFDLAQFKGKLGDKATLLRCFTYNDELSRRLEKLYLYAHICHDTDVRVAK